MSLPAALHEDRIGRIGRFGTLSKKEVFKWCIHAGEIQELDSIKRSDFFSFGPCSDAKFCLLLPFTNSGFEVTDSKFTLILRRVWSRPGESGVPETMRHLRIKVSFSLLDQCNRLHHTCERLMQDVDYVQAPFDRSCYTKHHQKFLRGGFLVLHCSLDSDEVMQENDIVKPQPVALQQVDEIPPLIDFTDESSLELIEDLSALLKNGLHSDLLLIVDEKDFRVHRAVLSARSPVFAAMFEHDTIENNQNRVVIKDISSDAIFPLLRYIYTGQTDELSVELALSLFAASDKYNLRKLKQECSRYLCFNLTSDMLLHALTVANMHNDENLKQVAIQGVLDNAVDVMKSDEWLLFLKQYPELANSIILELALSAKSAKQ